MSKHNENLYDLLSEERKKGQEEGHIPEWMTTGGYQLLKEKYLNGMTVKERHQDIANTAAKHAKKMFGTPFGKWEDIFFELIWKGWLSPATPIQTNMSSVFTKGCTVSCSGGYVGDSIKGFYDARREVAILTQEGFGTSSYMGAIRPRGSKISRGGKAQGTLPVFKGFVQDMRDVSQGSTRRGAWAGYIEIDHDDFWEIATFLYNNPDDFNLGWIVSDKFIAQLDKGDEEALSRWKRIMKIRAVTGKGYLFFVDKANRMSPEMYKDRGLTVLASNLCTEIMLHSSDEYTFTCVLSSMNLAKYDEWKDKNAIFFATIFLDCVAQHFIEQGKQIPGLERAVEFTENGRALGLGVLGFHTYLQDKMISFESFDAHMENNLIFQHLNDESLKASQWMAEVAGEPEWCKNYGVRNTHRLAIAPTMSTAIICGGVSQGIEPFVGNTFNQGTAGGEVDRVNPSLLKIMKDRNIYTDAAIRDIMDNKGSVQHVDWLSDEEKEVFKTAFEINQEAIIRLASVRGKYIDQGQSLNLFFDADEDERYVSHIHKLAAKDENIKSVYYMRSLAGVQASKGECVACEG